MPYIKKEYRDEARIQPANCGELNYAFTVLAIDYFQRTGAKYGSINDILGALEGAKLEFYRRVAAPYEDTKIAANGDVYPVPDMSPA